MRIDVYLFEAGLAASRTEAKGLIASGAVTVDGKKVLKPSFDVDGGEDVTVDRSGRRYVSRGGIKLEGALSAFGVSAEGRLCLDVGASSGGFTDCLLQSGAKHVIALDAGSGQMADALRRDGRVTVIEGYNARYMSPSDFEYSPSLAVMDVSFISATYIIPTLSRVLSSGADFICLIKPQFEVGRDAVGKGGIVKDEKARLYAVERVTACAEEYGLRRDGLIKSPIRGGDGNVEFLAHFVKE
ncbi:MAG: TlyA family RNA methyltransferase [Clostridia bacterium]|nr:TlyA family RNA methyltransferase [Clostridia bacterium]